MRGNLPGFVVLDLKKRKNSSGHGYSTMKLICQVCTRVGHSALVCQYRFDRSFQTPVIPFDAFLCERDGHKFDYDPSAYIGISDGDDWYVDTGASTHVVSSTDSQSGTHPYTGPDAFMDGNGKKLSIHNIGSSVLTTYTTPLKLKTVLQVLCRKIKGGLM